MEQTLEEKFLIAGFGVKAFFDITSLIMKMLAFITLVYAPVFYIYSHGNQFENSVVLQSMLGNLGGTHVTCQH